MYVSSLHSFSLLVLRLAAIWSTLPPPTVGLPLVLQALTAAQNQLATNPQTLPMPKVNQADGIDLRDDVTARISKDKHAKSIFWRPGNDGEGHDTDSGLQTTTDTVFGSGKEHGKYNEIQTTSGLQAVTEEHIKINGNQTATDHKAVIQKDGNDRNLQTTTSRQALTEEHTKDSRIQTTIENQAVTEEHSKDNVLHVINESQAVTERHAKISSAQSTIDTQTVTVLNSDGVPRERNKILKKLSKAGVIPQVNPKKKLPTTVSTTVLTTDHNETSSRAKRSESYDNQTVIEGVKKIVIDLRETNVISDELEYSPNSPPTVETVETFMDDEEYDEDYDDGVSVNVTAYGGFFESTALNDSFVVAYNVSKNSTEVFVSTTQFYDHQLIKVGVLSTIMSIVILMTCVMVLKVFAKFSGRDKPSEL